MAVGDKIRTGLMAGLLAGACLLLCSCTFAPLLSQREIVHAVFFRQQGTAYTAWLLLADSKQSAEGAEPAYRTVAGNGQNPAQALQQAEDGLEGQVFYGLLDLAVLPAQCDWQQAEEIARLLYGKTKPAPQILLFMMAESQEETLSENTADLYKAMMNAQERYGLENGLQVLFSQQNEGALPVWQGTGYGFVFLQKDKPNTVLKDPVSAQLAAVLAGQANLLECTFAQGAAALQAQASVQHSGSNTLYLILDNPELIDLSGNQREQKWIQQALCNELLQAFAEFVPQVYTDRFDPLQTRVWVTAASGIRERVPTPQLAIHLEP